LGEWLFLAVLLLKFRNQFFNMPFPGIRIGKFSFLGVTLFYYKGQYGDSLKELDITLELNPENEAARKIRNYLSTGMNSK